MELVLQSWSLSVITNYSLFAPCVHQCQVDFQLNMNTAYAALDIKASNYDHNGESYKTKLKVILKLNPIAYKFTLKCMQTVD